MTCSHLLAVNEDFTLSRVSFQRVSLFIESPADWRLAQMPFISLYAENNKTAEGSWAPLLSSLRGLGLDLSGRTLN